MTNEGDNGFTNLNEVIANALTQNYANATSTTPNNEELIAQARELCEKQIKEWQRVVTFLGGSKDKHSENQLNSWNTHLAEMDEHFKRPWSILIALIAIKRAFIG